MQNLQKQVLSHLDEDYCLDLLSQMVQHKSYSQTEEEKTLARWTANKLEDLGLATELTPVLDDRINVVATLKGTGNGKSLLFNGHLDTNPVSEGWTVDPWSGKVDDKFIYGIGVSNMKAGDCAYFCAIKTILDAGIKLKGDVVLTFVVGELQGGVGTHALVSQGIKADYFVNSEPTDLKAMTMHAGSFNFEIELLGNTRHLSKREEAVDAVAAACVLVPRLNAMKFSGAPSSEHEAINRVNVGIVHGALGKDFHEWRPAQVADFAKLKGSGRYAPGQTQESAIADMQAQLDRLEQEFPGLKATLTVQKDNGRLSMPAFEVPKESPIVRAINAAYKSVRGEDQPTGAILPPAFYGTDAGHLYAGAGMEGIVCGPGGRYNTMPDERVDIVDYLDMIRIYILTILTICEVDQETSRLAA